jgi:hypothetical protein
MVRAHGKDRESIVSDFVNVQVLQDKLHRHRDLVARRDPPLHFGCALQCLAVGEVVLPGVQDFDAGVVVWLGFRGMYRTACASNSWARCWR